MSDDAALLRENEQLRAQVKYLSASVDHWVRKFDEVTHDVDKRGQICVAALGGISYTDIEHALKFQDEFSRLCVLRDAISRNVNAEVAKAYREKHIKAKP